MDKILLTSIVFLSIMYCIRLTTRKFKYEGRKEILLLQIIIFSLCLIGALTNILIVYLPVGILVLALVFCPKLVYIILDKTMNKEK